VRGLDPAGRFRSRHQEPVVRADEEALVTSSQGERAALAPDSWIDDREVNALGHIRQRVAEDEGALEDVLRRDPVRDVEDLDLGRDPLHHSVARADEVVLEAEVRQERNEHGARC